MLWAKRKAPALPDIVLESERILLRPPCLGDWQGWAEMRGKNEASLKPFEPTWPKDCLSEEFFQRRLARQIRDWNDGRGQSFLILKKPSSCGSTTGSHAQEKDPAVKPQDDNVALIGGMNINNICRGAGQYASLGYWLDEGHQGQGYMREAIAVTLTHCFDTLKLHRVHASCVPQNERSKALLLRCGFVEEGFAENYLQINGRWQDHHLFGLTLEKFRKQDQRPDNSAQHE